MNNLKRIFSLGLTGAMLAGLMTVGAGAANFSDDADIKNTDAVNTMVALGVIGGRDTGAFDPNGNVTRAEMAKMLCVAINGGNDPTLGANAKPVYTDIAGHWAAKYIEYCTAMGYVSGRGDGTFDPNASVTSTEAAKMILTAMGYKADVSGFMGIDWAINTNAQANQSGLYNKLGGLNTNAPLNRDNAAQMLYNALDAKVVEEANGAYKYTTYTATEKKTYTVNNSDGSTSTFSTNETVTKDETFGHKYLTVSTYDKDGVYLTSVKDDDKGTYTVTLSDGTTFKKVAKDFSELMGEKVKVLYKGNDDDDVYGVYASGGAVLATGIVDDIDVKDDKIEVGGKSFKVDITEVQGKTVADTMMYAFNDFGDTTTSKAVGTKGADLPDNKAAEIKVVDVDDDGKIDHIVYTPFTVGKVTYVSSKNFTFAGTSVKFEEVDAYDGMAKNDYAMCIDGDNTVSGDDTYTKVNVITSGDITATRDSGAKFRVDGTWYTMIDDSLLAGASTTAAPGGTVKKAVVVNGFCFYLDTTKSVDTKDYAVVTKAADESGMNGPQVELLFTDGTKKVVDSKYSYAGDYNENASFTEKSDFALNGALVTYEIDDDEYVLTPASELTDDTCGFDEVLTITTNQPTSGYQYAKNNKSTIEGKYIDSDAVVFVKDGSKYKVITGAALARMDDAGTSVNNAFVNEDSATGYKTVVLAYVDGEAASGDSKYGFITSKIDNVEDGEYEFDLFTGSGDSISVTTTNGSDSKLNALAQDAVIEYVDDGEGIKVKEVYILNDQNDKIGAIVAYNGDDEFFLDGDNTAYEIDKDTVILCVNVKDHAGAEGEIAIADKDSDGNYIKNVMVLTSNKTAKLIVYCNDILGD